LAKKRYSGNAANMRQMVDDVCYSIKYVREHLNELVPGADVNKIYIGGHSAGESSAVGFSFAHQVQVLASRVSSPWTNLT